jgi:hypothetical protein
VSDQLTVKARGSLHVEPAGADRYRVTGGTEPHLVERQGPGDWRCDCKGFAYRGRCTHVAAVLLMREREAAVPDSPAARARREQDDALATRADDDVLALLGPSWEQMTPAERVAYGSSRHGPPVVGRMKTPALDVWHRELAAGTRTNVTFDALWRAACEEMNALGAPPECKEGYLAEARRIMRDALRRSR